MLLAIPAIAGWLVHYPLYFAIKKFIEKKALHSDHHDAVMFCLLFLFYPFYLVCWALILYLLLAHYWFVLVFIIGPFTAWCYVQVKKQTDNKRTLLFFYCIYFLLFSFTLPKPRHFTIQSGKGFSGFLFLIFRYQPNFLMIGTLCVSTYSINEPSGSSL